MYKGLGGMFGYLIGKYFGMGMVGRLLTAAAGIGFGNMLGGHNKPPNPYRGYKLIG
jgi:hypothetical protein